MVHRVIDISRPKPAPKANKKPQTPCVRKHLNYQPPPVTLLAVAMPKEVEVVVLMLVVVVDVVRKSHRL